MEDVTVEQVSSLKPQSLIDFIEELENGEIGIDTFFGDECAGTTIIKLLAKRLMVE